VEEGRHVETPQQWRAASHAHASVQIHQVIPNKIGYSYPLELERHGRVITLRRGAPGRPGRRGRGRTRTVLRRGPRRRGPSPSTRLATGGSPRQPSSFCWAGYAGRRR
jgi:hypothetical protein